MVHIPAQRTAETPPAPTICGLDDASLVELPDGTTTPLGALLDVGEEDGDEDG